MFHSWNEVEVSFTNEICFERCIGSRSCTLVSIFYVKKYIEHLAACSGAPLVRDGPLGAPVLLNNNDVALEQIARTGQFRKNCPRQSVIRYVNQ